MSSSQILHRQHLLQVHGVQQKRNKPEVSLSKGVDTFVMLLMHVYLKVTIIKFAGTFFCEFGKLCEY